MIQLFLTSAPGVISFCQSGSRVICNPPVMDTDDDWVVLVKDQVDFFSYLAGEDDWSLPEMYGDGLEETSRFQATRKGDTNLIVTDGPMFFNLFVAATRAAKHLNLLKKSDRVALFQAVLYENYEA